VYSFRQSVAAVGCLMLVANPYAIRYDAGFTLSFLSLFGITYIAPLLMYPFSKFRWIESEAGKAGFQTIAAQLAVLPVLIHLFEGFSPMSILANSFILPVIPVAMLLSFFAGTVGVLSLAAGDVLAFVARPVLQYVLELVRVFGSAEQVPFSKSWFLTCVYYAALVAVIAYGKRKIPKII
jgi:competence protein ComEC